MEDSKLKPQMKKICPDLYIPVINFPRVRDKLKAESKTSKRVIICGDFSKKVSWIRPQQSISLLQERPMCFPSIDKHLLIGHSACVRTHLFLGLISLLSLPPRVTTMGSFPAGPSSNPVLWIHNWTDLDGYIKEIHKGSTRLKCFP